MKKILLTLTLLYFINQLHAQIGQPLILGGNYYDEAAGVIEGPGNTSILLASSSSYSEDQDLLLWCLDANGVYQWHHAFGNVGFDKAIGIAKDASDSLWVLAQHQNTGGDNSNTLLYRLGSDGQPAYVRTFDLAAMEFPTTLFLSDNGMVLGGNIIDTLNGTRDIFILRTDAAGNELFRSVLVDAADDSLASVVEFNGNYFVCGTRRQSETTPTDILIQKLNITGQPVATELAGSSLSDWGAKVLVDPLGNLLFSGSFTVISNDSVLQMWAMLYDENLTPVWPNPTQTIGGVPWRSTDAEALPNGHYLVTGTLAENTNPDLFVYEIDANGIYAGSSSYGTFEPEWGKSVKRFSDGRVAFLGTCRNYGPGLTNLFYITVPEENLVSTFVPVIQVGVKENYAKDLHWFVKNNALFINGSERIMQVDLRVMNAEGKVVANCTNSIDYLNSGKALYYADVPGVYLVSVNADGAQHTFKCFLSGNGTAR